MKIDDKELNVGDVVELDPELLEETGLKETGDPHVVKGFFGGFPIVSGLKFLGDINNRHTDWVVTNRSITKVIHSTVTVHVKLDGKANNEN